MDEISKQTEDLSNSLKNSFMSKLPDFGKISNEMPHSQPYGVTRLEDQPVQGLDKYQAFLESWNIFPETATNEELNA